MIIGAILQTAAVDYAMMFAAQIVTGLGNGLNVSRHNKKNGRQDGLQWYGYLHSDFNGSFISR